MSGVAPPIRLLVVDDHAIVREGIRHVLQSEPDFVVVGEAGTGADALAIAARERPDVILLDINLGTESGLRVAEELRTAGSTAKVLILTVHDDREFVVESVRIGANGFLRKDTTPAELRAAVRAVAAGDAFFSPPVARQLTEVLREGPRPAPPTESTLPPSELTNRERQVLAGIARGLLNKEIAAELGISVRTVESHRDSLTRKLQLRSTASLTRYALDHGILER
jgi:DNA-binding NarL/FixJ family response regulator